MPLVRHDNQLAGGASIPPGHTQGARCRVEERLGQLESGLAHLRDRLAEALTKNESEASPPRPCEAIVHSLHGWTSEVANRIERAVDDVNDLCARLDL